MLVDNATVGHDAKNSRWWYIETLSRKQRPLRGMTKMLLVYIGFRRKWFTNYDDVPIFDHGALVLKETDPEPVGLEPVDAEAGAESPRGPAAVGGSCC